VSAVAEAACFWSLVEELEPEEKLGLIGSLGLNEAWGLEFDWETWAHGGQCAPPGDWLTWVLMGGRGFGKTRAGAEWVASLVAGGAAVRIALVAATRDEARTVMVEGKSGLLAVAEPYVEGWWPTRGLLRFRGGAEARLFSGASPDFLRGPEHHFAWCDELAKWQYAQDCWDMLRLGLRLGELPRALITTTPRPGPVLRGILAAAGTVLSGGPTVGNPHNPRAFTEHVYQRYAGTRLALQELEGQLLTDAPGALWSVALLERCRLSRPSPFTGEGDSRAAARERGGGESGEQQALTLPSGFAGRAPPSPEMGEGIAFARIVVAVDPPSGDGTCGIVACARDAAGRGHVLADHSVTNRSPEGWARVVAEAARAWAAAYRDVPVAVVAESNQGGKMVEAVIRAADAGLKIKLVPAVAGKVDRATPVAMRFETGEVTLHGRFPALEAELMGMIAGGGYEGPGKSPDRADAMVWGLTELLLGTERAPPRVRAL
jgi:phage terminase large subunit-like protein